MDLNGETHRDQSVTTLGRHLTLNAAEAARLAKLLMELVWQRFDQVEISAFTDYLSDTGWQKETEGQHGAIWSHPRGKEAFLPDLREPILEGPLGIALRQIALAEGRETYEVVADVVSHAEARQPGPKVRIEFELTDVAAIAEYLSATGWDCETRNSSESIWRHHSGMSVLVPETLRPGTDDLFQLVIHKIALVEGRYGLDVMADIVSHAGPQGGEIKVQTEPVDQLTAPPHPGVETEEPIALPTTASDDEVAPPEPSGSPASRRPTDPDFPESQDPTRRLDDLKSPPQDGTPNIDGPEL